MPTAITPKRRHQLEPITYDELLGNAGMSGFVSFLESPVGTAAAPLPELKLVREPGERRGRIRRAGTVEDGHSLAEQAVYSALWDAASPVHEGGNADHRQKELRNEGAGKHGFQASAGSRVAEISFPEVRVSRSGTSA